MVRVAMCVVNWNTPQDLAELVKSGELHENDLHWSVFQNFHDDMHGRNRVTLNTLKTVLRDRFIHQVVSQNHGHGYGINRAVANARRQWSPEYVFVINPDCKFVKPVVETLIGALEVDPVRFAVGPKQIDSLFRITAGGILFPDTKPQHRYWQRRDPANRMGTDRMSVPTVAGSAFVARSEDMVEFPMLESRHYYSETWPMYHARAHGREIWYIGDALMIHEWHRSTPVGSILTDGKMQEDRELFRRMCDEHDPPIPHD